MKSLFSFAFTACCMFSGLCFLAAIYGMSIKDAALIIDSLVFFMFGSLAALFTGLIVRG